jgi:hypothetical protein
MLQKIYFFKNNNKKFARSGHPEKRWKTAGLRKELWLGAAA